LTEDELRPYGDLDTYWTGYLSLEGAFSQFTTVVPLVDENREVISPKLADLVSSAGNWIDTIFKRMGNQTWPYPEPTCRLPKDIKNITQFRRTFEEPYRLSEMRVFVRRYLTEYHTVLKPFAAFAQEQSPGWFKDYSEFKHNRVLLQKKVTFSKAAEALAGLFLLNVYPFEMREYLLELGVIHGRDEREKGVAIRDTLLSHPNMLQGGYLHITGWVYADTPVFKFEFPRAKTPEDLTEMPSQLYDQWKQSERRRSQQETT
jgi:hypothetical protein